MLMLTMEVKPNIAIDMYRVLWNLVSKFITLRNYSFYYITVIFNLRKISCILFLESTSPSGILNIISKCSHLQLALLK